MKYPLLIFFQSYTCIYYQYLKSQYVGLIIIWRTGKRFGGVDCGGFIGTNLMEGIIEMNLEWIKWIYYVVLSVGHTLLYHRISICQEWSVDDSITNVSQGSLTLYEHEPFSRSS